MKYADFATRHIMPMFLITTIISLGLTACSSGESSGASAVSQEEVINSVIESAGNPADLVAEEGAVIEVTYWDGSTSDLNAWNAVLDDLEADHPEIKLIRQRYPSNEYWDVMEGRMASGDWPDVMRYQYQRLGTFKAQGVMLDLTPYLNSDDLKDISDGFLSACIYEGKVVALPHHTDVIALFYNKEMFESSGIRIPNSIEDAYSWDELKEISRTLKNDYNLYYAGAGIWENNYGYRYLPFVYMNGGSLLNADQTKVTINTPEVKEALQFYDDMRAEDLFVNTGFTAPLAANSLFTSEQIAYSFAGSWHCSYMEENLPGKWGVTYMPQKDGKTGTDMGGNGLFCYSGTKYPKAAAIVASYITSSEEMQKFCEIGNFIPVRKGLLESGINYENFPEEMRLFNEEALTLDPKMAADESSMAFEELNLIFSEEMDGLVINRSSSVDDVVKNCEKRMSAVLK